MSDNLRDWIIDRYDEFVGSEGDDGALVEKSRDAVAHAYADAVESGAISRPTVDLVTEGRSLFNSHAGRAREQRRVSMKNSAAHLLDALLGETVLGADDPALGLAYPLGDGTDKVLRLWTVDDWQAAKDERYRNAAAATGAAADFDSNVASEFIAALRKRGKRTTGDLFA